MSQWTPSQANAWYAKQPWLVGANFIPSNAINQLEMWQADTFDLNTIKRELGWAANIGMNTMRVYLHDLLWDADRDGFILRIKQFLDVAASLNIRPIFCIFDDCWNPDAKLGKQPEPKPGIHNSGWLQSPGLRVVNDPAQWPRLERYVKELLTHFANDNRVLMWDLYNEPGNNGNHEKSLPLVKAVFEWAQTVRPSQPLSVGVWFDNAALNEFQLAHSDVITFHNYENADHLRNQIGMLKRHGRPLICTEWLRRCPGFLADGTQRHFTHSEVATCLPVFKDERVGCINWGLVAGKTNTIYAWGKPSGDAEPPVWFHDLFRQGGTPYDTLEAATFKRLIQGG
jgi:hypothetical protein